MAPKGLAILIGAGPNTVCTATYADLVVCMLTLNKGTGIARILSHPAHGNLAVALLARRPESLQSVISTIRSTSPDAVLEAFPSDTSQASLEKAFSEIKSHKSFSGLKLDVTVYSVKHSSFVIRF